MNDNASGRWLPFNMDGSVHDCRNQTQTKQTGTKSKKEETVVAVNQQRIGPLTMEELESRLRKVESFLFMAGKK